MFRKLRQAILSSSVTNLPRPTSDRLMMVSHEYGSEQLDSPALVGLYPTGE